MCFVLGKLELAKVKKTTNTTIKTGSSFNMHLTEKMLEEILDNSELLYALPLETIAAMKADSDELRSQRERFEEINRVKIEGYKIAQEKKRREPLGLNIGDWCRLIPNNRRFVLAYRVGKKYVGGVLDDKSDSKLWENEDQFIPMDILRGYTAPYFAYCGSFDALDKVVKEKLLPVVNAKTEDDLVKAIEREFNFFKYDEARQKECPEGIAICDYKIDETGRLQILGAGELKPLAQHLAELKAEFCKE